MELSTVKPALLKIETMRGTSSAALMRTSTVALLTVLASMEDSDQPTVSIDNSLVGFRCEDQVGQLGRVLRNPGRQRRIDLERAWLPSLRQCRKQKPKEPTATKVARLTSAPT